MVPGIPESEFLNVFKPFYRIDKSRGLNKSGVGLGLSISQDIVKSHGERLRYQKVKWVVYWLKFLYLFDLFFKICYFFLLFLYYFLRTLNSSLVTKSNLLANFSLLNFTDVKSL